MKNSPKKEVKPIWDVMIDLETLGTSPNSVVLSIVAVRFDRTTIYANPGLSIHNGKQIRGGADPISILSIPVSMLECLAIGRVIDSRTAEFWKAVEDKSPLVESAACTDTLTFSLQQLRTFLNLGYQSIWAKSPTFDITILRSLSADVGVELAIDFRKEADVRTEILDYPQYDMPEVAKSFFVMDENTDKPLGKHNPICDCLIQIQAISEVYRAKQVGKDLISECS